MNAQYAQILAIAVPVLTLVAMNLALALGGERGTLLLPSGGPFRKPVRPANRVPHPVTPNPADAPANDEQFHRAA